MQSDPTCRFTMDLNGQEMSGDILASSGLEGVWSATREN